MNGNNRPFGHLTLSLKQARGLDPMSEEEPNTPSKSKELLNRRPLKFYAILLFFLFSTGWMLFFGGLGQGGPYSGGYYRKVMVSRMYTPAAARNLATGFESTTTFRPRKRYAHRSDIENSEARQREALEIADKLIHIHHQLNPLGGVGELTSGGGHVNADPSDLLAEAQAQLLQHQQQQQATITGASGDIPGVSEASPAVTEASATGGTQPVLTTIKQVFDSGETKELAVDTARVAFLDVMSDGIESQELENLGPDYQGWWSNVISSTGGKMSKTHRPVRRPTAALATIGSLYDHGHDSDDPELAALENGQCKIAVLDINRDIAPVIRARSCDVQYKRVWPFSRHKFGIDGVETLLPQDYQYAQEYWLSESIRNSSRFVENINDADFVFVDMWCYHTAWLAFIHPLGNRNTTNPEPYMRRSLKAVLQMDRFVKTKGGDFALVHPNPVMKSLFSEEAMCEDLASVYNLVPERSSLCVWTPESPMEGKAAIIPYVASLDLDFETDLENTIRETLVFYRGGCGHPDPSIRPLFAAGKMLRYELVTALTALDADGVDTECSCDICDNHMPHPELMENYRRARFCPILPSNVQSSRRLSEVVLAGCIPVFMGPPFHTLPLVGHVDYASMAIFLHVDNQTWINDTSPNYLQNHMAASVWRIDDPSIENHVIPVKSLEAAVDYLRQLDPSIEGAKRRAVLRERWKFYYGAVPEIHGGDGKTSALGELLMKQMCKRAAAVKRRLKKAAAQGVDLGQESDVQIRHASLMHGVNSQEGGWNLFG